MEHALSEEIESHRLAWRHLVGHLHAAGETERLFALIEQQGFLAGQADFFGNFGQTGADVEGFLLPAAIAAPAAAGWKRFLRYAAVALNLRGLAEDLAEPEILQALVREKRQKLALDLAGRLVDPLQRAAALAVIAGECRSDPALFRSLLESIGQSLEAPLPVSAIPAEGKRRGELLARMARSLGPDLTTWWPVWIGKAGLSPEQAAPVWRTVAESWLDCGDSEAPALWEALRQIQDPTVLLAFLPQALGAHPSGAPEEALAKLSSLFADDMDRRRAGFSFLSCLVTSRPGCAPALWDDRIFRQDIPWTPALLGEAGPLLASAPPERLEALAGRLGEPVLRAALRVVVLESSQASPCALRTEAALAAVDELPDGAEKLHFTLRYLWARLPKPVDEVSGQVASVARYLYETRYGAPADDLRRFLDLIARFFPAELSFQIESVFSSPASHPDVLSALTRSAETPALLDHMLKNAARYASLSAPNEAQAWRLRGDILAGAAHRLCLLGENPVKVMEDAAVRLLPREEDDVRDALARVLISKPEAAAQIAFGMQDGRRQWIAHLRAGAADPDDLKPSRLYAIVAQTSSLDTELSGLSALLGPPGDPELLDRAPDDRVDLCLRLGWHALKNEALLFKEDWDPRAILARIEPRLALQTDEQLVAWTPAIAALAAQPDDRQAVAEVTEAAERIAGLEEVPWSVRREALESLLASLPDLFFDSLIRFRPSRAGRRAKTALSTLGHLPLRLAPGKGRDELVAHWDEIQPLVTAAAERLDRPMQRKDENGDRTEELRNLIDSIGKSPSEPGVEPLVRRLWKLSPDPIREKLAASVTTALQIGGRPRAEAALCWWLHGHLAPRLGELDEPGLARAREATTVLAEARSLGSPKGKE